jgi:hypothetical protein
MAAVGQRARELWRKLTGRSALYPEERAARAERARRARQETQLWDQQTALLRRVVPRQARHGQAEPTR